MITQEEAQHLIKHCERLEEHIRLLELQNKNLFSSWGSAKAEAMQLRRELSSANALLALVKL